MTEEKSMLQKKKKSTGHKKIFLITTKKNILRGPEELKAEIFMINRFERD